MNDNCKYSALEKTMTFRYLGLLAVVASMATACTEIKIDNKPPIAVAELKTELTPEGFVAIDGDTARVEIDGSGSSDPDGEVVAYEWRRTDVGPDVRFGLGDAGPPPDDLDPPPDPTITLDLAAGHYRFTLWVTDNDNAIGKPASVDVQVGSAVTADPTCLENYPNPDPACASCICAPATQMGCLELYQNCFENEDAEFAALCTAIIECSIEKGCNGPTCYAADLCMAEIDAAATYNGAAGAAAGACAEPAEANPCAASSDLGECTIGADNCMATCM